MWLIQHDGLYNAPFPSSQPLHDVEIECGTGTWAVTFATEHLPSDVLVFDIMLP